MNIDLVIGYPYWFILFCILTGVGYATILYYKESRSEFSNLLKSFLAVVRIVTVALLTFLLLNPLIKSTSRFSEKPVIIFAQDNSSSVITNADSGYYKTEYIRQVNDFLDKINNNYTVDKLIFGENVNSEFAIDFTDKLTDISGLFTDINDKYSHQNVGALLIASDGIFNRGINPLYSSEKFDFPIYTIALGDTNFQKDLIITKVNYNRIAYLGNEFPVEVLINANKCKGQNAQLLISKGDTTLFTKSILVNSDNYFQAVNFQLKAINSGIQRYRIKISSLENEISLANNFQDIFIDVLDGKQKILLLANSPDPDISAIKQAVLSNKNYALKDYIFTDFDQPDLNYDLVILHGLPSTQNQIRELLDKLDASKTPVLFIVSKTTNLQLFNNRNAGIVIRGDKIIFNEAQPSFNEKFTLFRLSDGTVKASAEFPPLVSPYGNSVIQPSAVTLFNQKIGSVSTEEPLFLFNENQGIKTGVILGSGIWKWRMINFAKENNHEAFNELINKTIQYLVVKIDRSFFKVYTKNNFTENENVELDAELYNDNYELINEPEVSITITNSKATKYPFVFNKTEESYYLNAGKLPVDYYSYSARVNRGDKIYTDNGEFTVSSLSIEKTNTVANHNILYNLAVSRGGEMVYPSNLDSLANMINEREDIKPVVYSQERYTEILNFPLVLILVILLLSVEWFLRKRAGAY